MSSHRQRQVVNQKQLPHSGCAVVVAGGGVGVGAGAVDVAGQRSTKRLAGAAEQEG